MHQQHIHGTRYFDHLVDAEKTADAINDFFHQDSDERCEALVSQKTARPGEVGDQKPRTGIEALKAKKR